MADVEATKKLIIFLISLRALAKRQFKIKFEKKCFLEVRLDWSFCFNSAILILLAFINHQRQLCICLLGKVINYTKLQSYKMRMKS